MDVRLAVRGLLTPFRTWAHVRSSGAKPAPYGVRDRRPGRAKSMGDSGRECDESGCRMESRLRGSDHSLAHVAQGSEERTPTAPFVLSLSMHERSEDSRKLLVDFAVYAWTLLRACPVLDMGANGLMARFRGNGCSLIGLAGLRRTAVVALLVLLLSACSVEAGTETLQSGETNAAAEAAPATAAAPQEDKAGPPAATATMTVAAATPSARIADIRFGQHPDFERLVIDFAADEGAADGVPHWRIEKAPGEGVLRIHLPTVTETAFTEARLVDEFDWFTHVFVVRAPDRSLFVDVFIPAEYQARVQELRAPLRLVIDVAPGGKDTHILPASSELTVLITPRPGATVHGTVTVSGYSRHFEANNVIILQDDEGNELARAIATSTDYIETWGYFSAQLTVPARTGVGKLLVGEFDAQDGDFMGVTIPVQFGGS